MVLTFESADEILWCDHSDETFLAVPLYGIIFFSIFYKIKFRVFVVVSILGSERVKI